MCESSRLIGFVVCPRRYSCRSIVPSECHFTCNFQDLVKRSEEVRDIRKTFEVDKEDLAALESKSVAKGSAAKADQDKGEANEDDVNDDDDAGDASP